MLRTREQLEAFIEEAILALDIPNGDAVLEARCDDDRDGDYDEADDGPPRPARWEEERRKA